jgi:hypothetical protein
MPVRVAPEGAFLLVGTVTTASPSKVADVEATSASGTYSTKSDAAGTFVVPASGATTLRVLMSGYDTAIRQVTVSQDDQVAVELQQTPRPQPRPFSGRYTLTFTASPSCTLPAEITQRTYAARLYRGRDIGRPEDLVVWLDSAIMVGWGNETGFTGSVNGNAAAFPIKDDVLGDFAMIERVGDKDMAYQGTATGTVSEKKIATTFNGRVLLKMATGGTPVAGCNAPDHLFVFTR